MYQKLAQEAYAEDAPKVIETSFYAIMPAHLKRVLNQARLETASFETMVQHIEREMELNGLANPESTPFTGIHNVAPAANTNHERVPKITGTCFGCGHPGHLLRNCRKPNRDKRTQKPLNTNITNPCETCSKMDHETKDCYSGANWVIRTTWWKTPKKTGSTTSSTRDPPATTDYPAATNHGTAQYPAKKLLKPRLRFGDYTDFRYYTTSEPPKDFDKAMFIECSGQPSINWQRRWLIQRIIKLKKRPRQAPPP